MYWKTSALELIRTYSDPGRGVYYIEDLQQVQLQIIFSLIEREIKGWRNIGKVLA
jgi:hypothetical protein